MNRKPAAPPNEPGLRIGEVMAHVRDQLTRNGIDNARSEAAWIIEKATGLSREQIVLKPDRPLTLVEQKQIAEHTSRRAQGEPLQYVLGEADFRGWILSVGPGVLIPRPETELLVDLARDRYPGHGAVCDMCTGSGAIAVALAGELNLATNAITAIDLSFRALTYAQINVQRHQAKINLVQANLFKAFDNAVKFQLITANPPYIEPTDYNALPRDVRDYEPCEALHGGDRGTECLEQLLESALWHLTEDGWLLSEIGEDQAQFCRDHATRIGYSRVEIHRDLSGRERMLAAAL